MVEKRKNRQPKLIDLPEISIDASDYLTPEGNIKRSRKKTSKPSVTEEQITKKNENPTSKMARDEAEMTEYTEWINDH